MAYVALYRAYRPQMFKDVVGQQHIIKTLQNAIQLNKVAHAYLFCGPRGTGKTTLAKIMAKALNCEHGPSIEPCDECEVCKGIQKGTIPDVIEIDAASNNGADDIRALRDSVKYLPSVGRYKIYIIDEVHMLSNAAFNALLKTLEEPPKHVIFILATTEPYKLPNTILSRCQRFDFQSISMDDILKRLKIVAREENVKISEEAMYQIASSAEGGMRDALSLFDQCISYTVNPEISLDDVLAVSGNVSYMEITNLLGACLEGNGSMALTIADGIIKQGKEVPRIVNDIIIFLRDTLLYKNNAILEDKLMFHEENFLFFAKNVQKGVIYLWLNILNDATNNMRFSNQKRAFLELAILKMNDTKLQDESTLLDRIEQLEHMISNIKTTNVVNTPVVPQYEINIPSVEKLNEIKENKQEVVVNKVIEREFKENEIQIEDVENILNNGNKEKRLKLQSLWKQIGKDKTGQFIVQILIAGEIVAVSENSFIVVLQDLGFCNRLMSYENYVKIMEIVDEYNLGFTDYICLPKVVWNSIKKDYRNKYSADNPKPKLEKINIGVIKRKNQENTIVKEESGIEQLAYQYFDKENIEIRED